LARFQAIRVAGESLLVRNPISIQKLILASAAHPRRTIAAWAAAAALAIFSVVALLGGSLSTDNHPTDNRQSQRAAQLIDNAFPAGSRTSDVIVVHSDRYTVAAPQFRALVGRFPHGPSSLVPSPDRHSLLIPIDIPGSSVADAVVSAVKRADTDPSFTAAVTGDQTRQRDFNKLSQHDLKSGELQFGLPAALIVLMLVFGAVVAGFVPLVLAMLSIVVGLGVVAALAHTFELSVFVVNMLTGMGLALGIDYALFVVSRYREERGRGVAKFDAIAVSANTANRAVIFSGTAFVVAMLGMLIVPNSIMRSLAVGAMVVGVISVVAATTLLPALLGLLGDGVDRLRIPIVGRRKGSGESRFWGAVVQRVLRRPALSLGVSVAILLAAAAPIFGMHVGTSGASALPERFESRQGYAALQRYFPGATASPVEVVSEHGTSALERLRSELASEPRFGPGRITTGSDGTALLTAPVAGDPSGKNAIAAVRDLRSEISNTDLLVGGVTSENIDYIDSAIGPAPYVIALVLGLTLVLLTTVFRSLTVAALTVVLNLLSVGAAYGLIVLVFQHGVGAGLFGFTQSPTIEAWVPLFLFSVLFGLSMDYQVFLLSRIKERHDHVGDTAKAVTLGVASTARIITGAALIIVAVFTGFARGELIMFQQMGFGVAVALLLDATIVRSVLLPSAMKLLGERSWYLPHWLSWMPRLQVEGGATAPSARRAPA
jgi:putative drug exporter of the RND superfamily